MSQTEALIFISVASFCDPLLVHTVHDGVLKAQHPQRLVWGIIDQHPEDRQSDLQKVATPSVLRYVRVHPAQSRGVCWARSMVGSLYAGEAYLLQIDSHMLFEAGWDSELIGQMKTLRLRSAKPILSIYPYGFRFEKNLPVLTDPDIDPQAALVFRVAPDAVLSEAKVTLSFHAVPVSADEPPEGFHLAGGFIFAPGRLMQELVYDPQLYFHGEEQSLALRAYTQGWDIFHPIRIPLYHHYKPAGMSHETQHWQAQWEAQRDFKYQDLTAAAEQRLQNLVDTRGDLGVFGLGNVRSLRSFSCASGIDYPQRRLRPPLGPPQADMEHEEDMVHVVELNPYHPRPFVFTDYARSLVEALRAAGQRAQHVVNALPYQGRLLVLGWTPQWLEANKRHVHPGRAILFNAEPLTCHSSMAVSDYLKAMTGWVVADVHESNVKFMEQQLGGETVAVELPVVSHAIFGLKVPELQEPEVDVILVGSTSERRRLVLQKMAAAGLTTRHVEGAYGLELMPWLQKAKMLVHVHHGESRLFPVLRMLRPVMMGLPVVSETSVFSGRNDWSNSGMRLIDPDGLIQVCWELQANDDMRRHVGMACHRHAQSMNLDSAWQELMNQHNSRR